jgi:hypothetical protein
MTKVWFFPATRLTHELRSSGYEVVHHTKPCNRWDVNQGERHLACYFRDGFGELRYGLHEENEKLRNTLEKYARKWSAFELIPDSA